MPDKCRFCKSGKAGSTYNGSYHWFPSEAKYPSLRLQWIKAVPEADFVPKNSTRLCELHFNADDFKEERTDTNVSRGKARGSLLQRELKDDAVPHLWPGYAGYKSKKVAKRRSLTTSSEGRAQKEKASLQAKIDEERQKDSVSSFIGNTRKT